MRDDVAVAAVPAGEEPALMDSLYFGSTTPDGTESPGSAGAARPCISH